LPLFFFLLLLFLLSFLESSPGFTSLGQGKPALKWRMGACGTEGGRHSGRVSMSSGIGGGAVLLGRGCLTRKARDRWVALPASTLMPGRISIGQPSAETRSV